MKLTTLIVMALFSSNLMASNTWHKAVLNCDIEMAFWLSKDNIDPNKTENMYLDGNLMEEISPLKLLLIRLEDSRVEREDCLAVARIMTNIRQLHCVPSQGCVDFVTKQIFLGENDIPYTPTAGAAVADVPSAPSNKNKNRSAPSKRNKSSSNLPSQQEEPTQGSFAVFGSYEDRSEHGGKVKGLEAEGDVQMQLGKFPVKLYGKVDWLSDSEKGDRFNVTIGSTQKYSGIFSVCDNCETSIFLEEEYVGLKDGPFRHSGEVTGGLALEYQSFDTFGEVSLGMGGNFIVIPEGRKKEITDMLKLKGSGGMYLSDNIGLVGEFLYGKSGVFSDKVDSSRYSLYGGVEMEVGDGYFLETGVSYLVYTLDDDKYSELVSRMGVKKKF